MVVDKSVGISVISAQAARRNLAVLVRLRWIAIVGQIAAILVSHLALGVTLPMAEMAPVIGFLLALNLFSSWRLRVGRPVSDLTVMTELLLDVIALTMLLYLSGGASNPFVSLFILQVILAIVLLPARNALVILAATLAAHYWLLGNGLPLILPGSQHAGHAAVHDGPDFFDLHLQGMFLSFALAACLLAWFVIRIRENLRDRDRQIAALQRQMLEEDHLVRLGLLSTGAAHELGTPLTTLAVTLDDWRSLSVPEGIERDKQLDRMLTELGRCRRIVSDMLLSSGQERLEEIRPIGLAAFLTEVFANWQCEGGDLQVNQAPLPAITLLDDPVLEQVLRQVLDNAQEAGARRVVVSAKTDTRDWLVLSLTDDGPGFPPEVLQRPGQPDHEAQSANRRGLGLFLVVNAMRRLQGTLAIDNPDGGGAAVTLAFPRLRTEGGT